MSREILEVSRLHHAWKVYIVLVTLFWVSVMIPNSITGIHYRVLGQESDWPHTVSGLALIIIRDNTFSMSAGLIPIVGSLFAAGNVFLTGQIVQYYLATDRMMLSDMVVRFAAFGWLEFVALALLVTGNWLYFKRIFVLKWERGFRLSIILSRLASREDFSRFVMTILGGLSIMTFSAVIEAFLLFNRWIV